jgi:glutaredoxin-related protein
MKEDLNIYKNKYKIDQIGDYNKGILRYLPGDIYIQPWAPITSTETRLVGNREDLKKSLLIYSEEDYTSKFVFYNNILRQFVIHENKYFDREREICYCGDCALECQILEDYRTKINPTFDILEGIDILKKLTKFKRDPNIPPHGLYERTTYQDIKDLVAKYKHNCTNVLKQR